MGAAVIELPPPGRWALGSEALPLAEVLLQLGGRQGLRTGWLGAEARFLSNLTILDNLRLLFQWREESEGIFAASLDEALATLGFNTPEWLRLRPDQLREPQLLRAGLLRVWLLRPEVLVLQPAALAQAGPDVTGQLVAAFAEARLLLLAEPAPDWPAWPLAGATSDAQEIPA